MPGKHRVKDVPKHAGTALWETGPTVFESIAAADCWRARSDDRRAPADDGTLGCAELDLHLPPRLPLDLAEAPRMARPRRQPESVLTLHAGAMPQAGASLR